MTDLYDVTRLLAARPADDAVLARPVAFRGVGARREGEAAALLPDGEVVGSLVGGVLDGALRAEVARAAGSGPAARLVDLPVGDAEAAAAGLACGGVVSVLLQRAAALPARVEAALAAGEPAVLVTDLRTGDVDEAAVAPGAGGARAAAAEEARRSGRAGARLLPAGTVGEAVGQAVVEALVPTTRLLLVGSGVLAEATARQAALLGWEATVVDDVATAEASLAALGPAGAMVTFAHRAEVDDPVLTAALRGGLRYVGALGSRRTQAARRERLSAAGLGDDALDRVHGPVGLDLGARTPEETALAVCGEVLAVLSGRGAASLRDTRGSIHA